MTEKGVFGLFTSSSRLTVSQKVGKCPMRHCEPFDTLRINSARQSSAKHCPERNEGSPFDTGRSFDPPTAASGRLALQVGLPRLPASHRRRSGYGAQEAGGALAPLNDGVGLFTVKIPL